METVITRVVLNEGDEEDWDAVMRDRMQAAESSPGWIGGCILAPRHASGERLILGLWESTDAWKQWHEDPAFRGTAERLSGPERDAGTPEWHDVVYAGGRFKA